jgi:hypothetical protein
MDEVAYFISIILELEIPMRIAILVQAVLADALAATQQAGQDVTFIARCACRDNRIRLAHRSTVALLVHPAKATDRRSPLAMWI